MYKRGYIMNYKWVETVYSSLDDMLFAIAENWVTDWGRNTRTEVLHLFEKYSDSKLATKLIKDWGLDIPQARRWSFDYNHPSHMIEFKYTKKDLTKAFTKVREWCTQNYGLSKSI